ncbi:MAG TPA: helix-turn-helix domain-containing protein [Solirubrobacteraceae bacterium]|nr:helix-turn-helix domain-containing protein [Solirubrobacteraceae bacterium]
METDVDMSRPLADGASPTDDWAGITHRDDDGIADDDRGGRARADGPDKVLIELSRAQVDRIVRNAADGGNMSVLLSGLKDIHAVLAREPRQLEDSRLSRSLLAGLLMLASFPSDGSYLGNAEIARLLDMNPSTTHRYVSTLVAVGLLERDPATRRYRLT